MDVFISVDIEGATGVASFSQCGRPERALYDYAFARKMLTHDINAAVRGAKSAGAQRIVIKDAHATCKNLLVADLESGVELISGLGPVQDGMMDGVDSSFGAAMLIGYHAKAGTIRGMMDHALVGGLHRFWIDGVEAGEIAVSALVAGAYGVPLVCVTGDDATCEEASATIPGVEVYSTKEGLGRYMGKLRHPSETGPGIRAAAAQAVTKAAEIVPLAKSGPVTMQAEFGTTNEAELAATLPRVNRLDGYTLEFSGEDFLQAHRLMLAVFNLSIQGRRSEA